LPHSSATGYFIDAPASINQAVSSIERFRQAGQTVKWSNGQAACQTVDQDPTVLVAAINQPMIPLRILNFWESLARF